MKKQKLLEVLKDQTLTNQFDFSGSCPDKDGTSVTFTIFNTAYFMSELRHNYFNRVMFLDDDNPFTDLCSVFTKWAATRGLLYARIAYAYSLGYNPIENYASNEHMSRQDDLTHGKVTTRLHSNDNVQRTFNNETMTRAYANDAVSRSYSQDQVTRAKTNVKDTTTYTNLSDAKTRSKYGVNSSNAVPLDTDTTTRNGVVEDAHTGTETETHSGGYSDTHTGGYSDAHTGSFTDAHTGGYSDTDSGKDTTVSSYTLTRSGNIGVMTASQMIQSEYDGLKQDLARRALKEFLDYYTFYCEEVDLW